MKRLVLCLLCLLSLLAATSCTRDPVKQAENQLKYGNRMFEKGKYKEASIMYRRALQKNPRFGEAYYRLGLTDIRLGEFPEAVRALTRAVELDKDNTDAPEKLADIYLAAYGRDEQHRKQILGELQDLRDTVVKRNPKSYNGLRISGYLALIGNNIPEAIKDFEAANAQKPYQPDLILALVQALTVDNQFPKAEQLSREMIAKQKAYAPLYDFLYAYYVRHNQMDAAEKILLEKVANNPTQAAYRIQLAGHYFAARRPQDADATLQKLLADPKDFPMAHILVGDFYLRVRNFDRASQEYQAGIQAGGKEKSIYQKRMVQVLVAQNKKSHALQLVEEILKEQPKDSEAIEMRAALQLQTGNPQQVQAAIKDLQALVQKNPDNAPLRYDFGHALMAKGERDQAAVQFQEAIKLQPNFVPPKVLLAQVLLTKGDYPHAGVQAEEALKLAPMNLQAHLIHANSLIGMGQKDRARQELENIIKINPNANDARYQLGYLSFLDKDYKEAEGIFRELYTKSPNDARGLVGVAESEVAQGRSKNAVQLIESEIEKEPNRDDFKLALGNIEFRAEQYDDALKIFQDLAGRHPKSSDLYVKLAETYRRKGNIDQAVDNFRHASELNPSNPVPLLSLALLLDGEGRRDQAKPLYDRVLKLDPDNAIALNNLAFIKADEGTDLDQALTMAQRAKQKAPNDVNVADTLGWVYYKKNLNDNAVGIFRDLVNRRPNNPIFHYHLAMALYQSGDKSGAKKELEIALKYKPSKEDQGKIQTLIAKIG